MKLIIGYNKNGIKLINSTNDIKEDITVRVFHFLDFMDIPDCVLDKMEDFLIDKINHKVLEDYLLDYFKFDRDDIMVRWAVDQWILKQTTKLAK